MLLWITLYLSLWQNKILKYIKCVNMCDEKECLHGRTVQALFGKRRNFCKCTLTFRDRQNNIELWYEFENIGYGSTLIKGGTYERKDTRTRINIFQ